MGKKLFVLMHHEFNPWDHRFDKDIAGVFDEEQEAEKYKNQLEGKKEEPEDWYDIEECEMNQLGERHTNILKGED